MRASSLFPVVFIAPLFAAPPRLCLGSGREGGPQPACQPCAPVLHSTLSQLPLLQGTPSLEALKLLYYSLMIRFYLHESNYLEVCRCYR